MSSTAGKLAARTALALIAAVVSFPAPSAALLPCEHWVQVMPGTAPDERVGHAMVWDSDRKVAILFGGEFPEDTTFDTLYRDVWEYDPVQNTWTEVAVSGTLPASRFNHAMAYDSGRKRVVMFGGQDGPGSFRNDTWEYDPAAKTWEPKDPGGLHSPPTFRPGGLGGNCGVGLASTGLAYDPIRRVTVLFGGKRGTDDGCFDGTTWEWNGTSWALKTPADDPGARGFHTLTWHPGLGQVVLYGGFYDDGDGFAAALSDTWSWNGAAWTSIGDASGISGGGHATAWDPVGEQLVAIGDVDGAKDATYVLPTGATEWQLARSDGPSRRVGHTMVIDDRTGRAILFGGRESEFGIFGDTWFTAGFAPEVLAPPVPSAKTAPCLPNTFHAEARTDARGAGPFTYQWQKYVGNDRVPLLENPRFTGTQTDELTIDPFRPEDAGFYSLEVTNACGSANGAAIERQLAEGAMTPAELMPVARSSHALAYDVARDRMVLHGGWFATFTPMNFVDALHVSTHTYERDGAGTWSLVATTGPPARYEHAMAYDEARGVTVLFGGYLCETLCSPDAGDLPIYYGDTWEWDRATWTERPGGPPARFGHAMTYDSVRGRVVMFGGRGANGSQLGDLWEWTGDAWVAVSTLADPVHGHPRARERAGLAFDRKRGVLVLHGGGYFLNPPAVVAGETWELAGSQWTRKAVPPTLDHALGHHPHVLAYDQFKERTLLFSLVDPQKNLALSFWDWDGTTWRHQLATGFHRQYTSAAYDTVRKRTLFAGGDTNFAAHDSTFEWGYFDFDPTCGVVACGDGVLDTGELCEPRFDGLSCCTADCGLRLIGACVDTEALCAGECMGFSGCVCPAAVCGNGVLELGEACDDGAANGVSCCTAQCTVRASGPCGDVCRGDACVGGSAPVCAAGTANTNGCTAATSALAWIDEAGGTLTTPDGAVSLEVPPGNPGTYAIAGGLATSEFGIGADATRVRVARITPAGATFSPAARVTFTWPDANSDGVVDGTGIGESVLRIYKDGVPASLRCFQLPPSVCDQNANTLSISVFSLSEFVLVGEECLALDTKPTLVLGKVLPPAGDDTLAFKAARPAPNAAIDPLAQGLGVRLSDADGVVVDATLPAGAYAKATKHGWKVDKKRTKWTWTHPKAGAPGGVTKATVTIKKGVLTVAVKGVAGAYAATPPLAMRITFPGAECARTDFAASGLACAVKSKGKTIACKPRR